MRGFIPMSSSIPSTLWHSRATARQLYRLATRNTRRPPPNSAAAGPSRAGKRLMGFCRTNLFKRLESCGSRVHPIGRAAHPAQLHFPPRHRKRSAAAHRHTRAPRCWTHGSPMRIASQRKAACSMMRARVKPAASIKTTYRRAAKMTLGGGLPRYTNSMQTGTISVSNGCGRVFS